MANTLRTYGDVTSVEDVLSIIETLTALESSIHNKLGKTTAISVVHETMDDDLAAAGSLAVAETGDYTAAALTTPSRRVNLVQHVTKPFKVSRTQQLIDHLHKENELVRQTTKAMKEWHNATEYDLVRSTLTSGVSGTAPKMSKRLTPFIKKHIIKTDIIIKKLYAKASLQVRTLQYAL